MRIKTKPQFCYPSLHDFILSISTHLLWKYKIRSQDSTLDDSPCYCGILLSYSEVSHLDSFDVYPLKMNGYDTLVLQHLTCNLVHCTFNTTYICTIVHIWGSSNKTTVQWTLIVPLDPLVINVMMHDDERSLVANGCNLLSGQLDKFAGGQNGCRILDVCA